MRKITLLAGVLSAMLTCSPAAHAQAPDAVREYQRLAGPRSILYRARQADNYTFSFNGTPYWEYGDFLTGDIVCEGRTYYGIPFRIDAHKHRVLAKMDGSPFSVALLPQQVSSITADGRRFEGVGPGQVLAEGFYEVFGEGPEQVYKRVDKFQQSSVNNVNGAAIGYDDPNYRIDVYRYFSLETTYYFRDAEGRFTRIKGKNALLNHFPERKAELRKALRDARIGRRQFDECCRLVLKLTSR